MRPHHKAPTTRRISRPGEDQGVLDHIRQLKSRDNQAWAQVEQALQGQEKVREELASANARILELEQELDDSQREVDHRKDLQAKLEAALLTNQKNSREMTQLRETAMAARKIQAENERLRKELQIAEATVKDRTRARNESEARMAAAMGALQGKLALLKPTE